MIFKYSTPYQALNQEKYKLSYPQRWESTIGYLTCLGLKAVKKSNNVLVDSGTLEVSGM